MSQVESDSRWIPQEVLVRQIAKLFKTPIYVVNEAHFRNRIREYQAAIRAIDSQTEITYASKANSTAALLKIAHQEGCLIDVASEGELRAAILAGIPPQSCHFHGNNKSRAEIEFAISQGIAQIVVDHYDELELILELRANVELLLRVAPGVLPMTNEKISTGQLDTKFGFNVSNGSAEKAVNFCLENNLKLVGLHCHVGSQLLDPGAQIAAGEVLAQFALQMNKKWHWNCEIINVGGGRAVRYLDEKPLPLTTYCQALIAGIRTILNGSGLNPRIVQEPGRSLIAESGVTIYEVGVLKNIDLGNNKTRRYVIVNGGLADNPRPALYGSKYDLIPVAHNARSFGFCVDCRVSGRHCETDLLFDDVLLPNDLEIGDYVVVLTTGAYSSSMASNYNRYPRAGTVLVRENGSLVEIQKEESFDTLFAREVIPTDL